MLVVCLAAACQGAPADLSPPMRRGYEVYRGYCNQCHPFVRPDRYTAFEWPAVVERMRIHMREKKRREMSDDETEALLLYLGRPPAD